MKKNDEVINIFVIMALVIGCIGITFGYSTYSDIVRIRNNSNVLSPSK